MCANERCWYRVHQEESFGGFCCKRCHNHSEMPSEDGRKHKHGRECGRSEAPDDARRASPQAPDHPRRRRSHCGGALTKPDLPRRRRSHCARPAPQASLPLESGSPVQIVAPVEIVDVDLIDLTEGTETTVSSDDAPRASRAKTRRCKGSSDSCGDDVSTTASEETAPPTCTVVAHSHGHGHGHAECGGCTLLAANLAVARLKLGIMSEGSSRVLY